MSGPMTNRELVESFYEAVGEKAVVGEDGVKVGDIEEGNTIVVLATYGGIYKPTRKSFSEPTAHVWDLKGGKIVRFRQYVDTASLWGQIEDRSDGE